MCLLLCDTAEMACRVAQRITYVTNDTNGNPDFRNNFTKLLDRRIVLYIKT
jgi:hypothetical protein